MTLSVLSLITLNLLTIDIASLNYCSLTKLTSGIDTLQVKLNLSKKTAAECQFFRKYYKMRHTSGREK